MSVHLERAVHALKKKILRLGGLVEESVRLAATAVEERDEDLAEQVIRNDSAIDQMEVEVEEEALKLLALYQPVAVDLRFIIVAIKINNELERIGDVAVNVAERAQFLARHPQVDVYFRFAEMAERSQSMLKRSLDSLVNIDIALAKAVCADDDEVDSIHLEIYNKVAEGIQRNPEHVEAYIHSLGVSRHLERIADLATNIAEEVMYMISGEIVRHHVEDFVVQTEERSASE
jgi:phosphate transport system protein